MKHIRKSSEPTPLTDWKAALRPRTRIPDWDNEFDHAARTAIRAQLFADQGQLCCYCMGSIANGAYHIEHFKPRSKFPSLTYHWSNLLASCEGYWNAGGSGVFVDTQRQCGQAKDDWFSTDTTVDPQHIEVESLFRYRLDGVIAAEKTLTPARKAAVNDSIKNLNLNAPSLVERRKQLLAQATKSFEEMGRGKWRDAFLATQVGGPFQEFWAALDYNFRKHWDAKFAKP